MSTPYAAACERFERAKRDYSEAKTEAARLLREAATEYDRAQAGLCQYETSPGIPLPQYAQEGAA